MSCNLFFLHSLSTSKSNLEAETWQKCLFCFFEGDFGMCDQTKCTRETAYLKHQKDSDMPLI